MELLLGRTSELRTLVKQTKGDYKLEHEGSRVSRAAEATQE
jgi:hypothetical protein